MEFIISASFLCPECLHVLWPDLKGGTLEHLLGSYTSDPLLGRKPCPNAGKVFRVPTVELKEVLPDGSH